MTDRPEIIPQHYSLWVREWMPGGRGSHITHPIIGWVWREPTPGDGWDAPYLHPVIAADVGATPYEPLPADVDWEIVDQKSGPDD